MEVIRVRDLVATPWKNGGGVTRQIAAGPPDADFANFDWRLSLAIVEAGGPFSTFPGVDRLMLILDGELELEMAGATPSRLTAHDSALEFPGDAPVAAATPSAPVTDINVMVRRGLYTSSLERRRAEPNAAVVSQDVTFILACNEGLALAHGADNRRLDFGDVARIEAARGALVRVRADAPTEFVVAHVNAVRG
jgi:environmental stress-induced protein Ves